jgi:glyoxalase/bleomycin resistance protein/dioxygenase superfamily protein
VRLAKFVVTAAFPSRSFKSHRAADTVVTPDFVLFDTNSIPFALTAAKVSLNEAPQPGWGMTLWIDCDQVNELHTKMEAKGATIVTPPFDGPFGRTFVFADPDGYRITANENPWDRFPLGGKPKS